MKYPVVIILVLAFLPAVSLAKRVPQPKVKPLVHNGVKYVAPNSDGEHAFVQAYDVKTGKVLWQQTIFKVNVVPILKAMSSTCTSST